MKRTIKYKKVYSFLFLLALASAIGLFRVLTYVGFSNAYPSILGLLLVISSSIFVVILANCCCESLWAKTVVICSFGLRPVLTYTSIYIHGLWGSWYDEIAFYRYALKSYLLKDPSITWTSYTSFLQHYFDYVGTERFNTAFVNAIFYTSAIVFISKLGKKFDIEHKYIDLAIVIYMLSVVNLLNSCYVMRESLLTFFITAAIYLLISWMKTGNYWFIVLFLILYFLIHKYIHQGYIGLLGSILLVYGLWRLKSQKLKLNFKTIIIVIIAILMTYVIFYTHILDNAFLYLYSTNFKWTDIFNRKMDVEGGSDYLTWMTVTSLWQVIPYSFLKMFYFQFSPVIWEARPKDFVAIVIDVLPYFIIIGTIIHNVFSTSKHDRKGKTNYLVALFIIYLCTMFPFAWGTMNAGTAMRHRGTLLPILLVMYMLSTRCKEKQDNEL